MAILGGLLFLLLLYGGNKYVGLLSKNSYELQLVTRVLFGSCLFLWLLLVFLFLKKRKKREEKKKQLLEQTVLKQYIQSIEKQYSEIRDFKHDYLNILVSLEGYMMTEDYDGLKNYYLQQIKPASSAIYSHEFQLADLANIQIEEVKGLILLKLITAQNQGIEIYLEVEQPILMLPIDSISFIRILGILLDNAIEEIQRLKTGRLTLLLFEDGSSFQLVVENSCSSKMPKVHELRKKGFSTKGKNRGLGLNSMHELICHLPNTVVETEINQQIFRQHVIIDKKR